MNQLGISGQLMQTNKAAGRGTLIGYLPVGYPNVASSINAMQAIAQGEDVGVDIVEIGMPYSDPMMDGPTIQYATTKALAGGVRTRDLFQACTGVAAAGALPMVMIYWNLVEHYGVQAFARDLANAGGAGLITPDLTPDEADEWLAASDEYGLDRVFLIAPSSTDERLKMTLEHCRGWVYATAVMGVTGARTATSHAAPVLVQRAKQAVPELPVAVGLGISNGEQAAETVSYANGAIVGSALVRKLIEASKDKQELAKLSQLRQLASELARGVGKDA